MVKKQTFKPVSTSVNFAQMEKERLTHWYEKGIVDKYLHKNDNAAKRFSFLDGPITANNPMGVHHAWGRTYKDVWQRFKNMQGFRQRFQNGFDCQGLWVEVEVEKELGLKNKKDIENLIAGDKKASIAKFVELCRERVKKYAAIQTEQSKRLGYCMDWDHSYFTMSQDNNYMIWHFLKKCYEENLIYKGHDVVPWCPRCETAISQHEMLTEDYKEITHDSIFIEYPIDTKNHTYLLAWTTTPWTLPGNVAVAVDPQKDYVEAEGEIPGNVYILVAEAAVRLKLKITKTFKGKELVGLTYASPFDSFPRVAKALRAYKHRVVASDPMILPVTVEEGTGMVHIAPGQGAEDFQLGKKEKLPVIELIDDEAFYLEGLESFSGQSAKKHPEIIIEYLTKSGNLFDTQKYTHRYPACWRCKTELVWKVADEWYISMDRKLKGTKKSLREMMIDVTKKITWIPDFGMEREIDWLGHMHDWLISKKNRYWGLALPIWECKTCGTFQVIGDKKELQERTVSGWDTFDGHSPHKPWIDDVIIKCSKCNADVPRILDVGNPWLDAGIVPFSTITKDNVSEPLYISDKKEFNKWFPVEFITESFPGQFKNWFYSLIAMSTMLEYERPFKTVLGFGTLTGEDGRPMHKSWGNAVEFNEGADKIGADVMRWMYVKHNPADNLLFGYKGADETRRKFHILLWNVYNFFVTYANVDGWSPSKNSVKRNTILDQWIVSKLNGLITLVTKSLEQYDAATAANAIEAFVTDLSQWYVRRSRERVGPSVLDKKTKEEFYQTTYDVLVTLCKILAPFVPYMADEIYVNLTGEESVHLSSWPQDSSALVDEALEKEMTAARLIVELAHAKRKEQKLKVRQPLATLETLSPVRISKPVLQLIADEVNVKNVTNTKSADTAVTLDMTITDTLRREGEARELAHKIQMLRKEKGCTIDEQITVTLPRGFEQLPKHLLEYIQAKTLAKELTWGETIQISTG
jgi:isoleucyl-tRNA synthetase